MAHPTSATTTAFPPTPDRSQSVTPTDTATKLTQAALPHPPPGPSLSLSLNPLLASALTITRTTTPLPIPPPDSPEIWSQKIHTDHMLTATWTSTAGWSTPTIIPYAPLTLSPMSSALHYATECFEGMKAYRSAHDGKLRLFRPRRNCERMLKSATRIALPGFDPEELQGLLEKFVALEGARWVPKAEEEAGGQGSRGGSYLYLRPTMIGTGEALGVQRPTEALLFIVAVCFPPLDEAHDKAPTPPAASAPPSPQPQPTSSIDGGAPPPPPPPPTITSEKKQNHGQSAGMRLLASSATSIRAWPGGFGNAKVGANYGPSLVAQSEARARGYHQILWLFGSDCHVTEAGASNFFVLWWTRERRRLQLVTAPLGDGVILDGVTRRSVLELVRRRWAGATSSLPMEVRAGMGTGTEEEVVEMEVVERKFTMAEMVEAAEEGRLVEAFGCGTAFFITPVAEIHFRGVDLELPLKRGVEARYAMTIKRWLSEIMFGVVDHEWGVVVDES